MTTTTMGTTQTRFTSGQLVATPGALEAFARNLTGPGFLDLLARHLGGDWGDVDAEDAAENDFSVPRRLRILSSYRLADGTRIWLITEADRTATTALLPEEY
jgi:hypothetical protein